MSLEARVGGDRGPAVDAEVVGLQARVRVQHQGDPPAHPRADVIVEEAAPRHARDVRPVALDAAETDRARRG